MTDPGEVASLPDETSVADLPLRQHTIKALRAGHVLTLGELRAMRDRDLVALRLFGRGALAEVRRLVPVPGGDAVTTTTEELAAVLAQIEVAEELAAHAAHALAEAEELAEEDPAAAAEVERCRAGLAVAEERLAELQRRRRELGG